MIQLPMGVRISKGYVQVRIRHDGITQCKNFGKDSPLARQMASIYLNDRRKEIIMGKAGIAPSLPSKRFDEVADIFLGIWSTERDPDGKLRHDEAAVYGMKGWIDRQFKPAFGKEPYECIRPIDVQRWRDTRVKEVSGTTANREQGVLSSIFGHIEAWVKSAKIKPFKIPIENPCKFIEKAKQRKRERILTMQEARKLKDSFMRCEDPSGWENCRLALKSVLSLADLKRLEIGDEIETERSKTHVRVAIPTLVLAKFDAHNWRKRWEKARTMAGLSDVQFRDLRKTGGNWLLATGKYDMKHISQYMGHADVKTTEGIYMLRQQQVMQPLADDLAGIVETI